MACILTFRAPESCSLRRTDPQAVPAGRASAEVVIFPGVRYDYQASSPGKSKPQRRPKRDLLEIER